MRLRAILTASVAVAGGLAGQGAAAGPAEIPAEIPVRATLVDGAGQPIAGAGVIVGPVAELYTADALARPVARSDAQGHLRLTARRYVYRDITSQPDCLLIAHPRFATVRIALSSTSYHYTPWGSYPKPVLAYDLGRLVLLPGKSITGLVRGRLGRPLAGARVEARELLLGGFYMRNGHSPGDPTQFVTACRTGADGRFVLPGALPQGMSLAVAADGYYSRWLPFVDDERPVDVALETSGFLSGRVVGDRGEPVAAVLSVSFEGAASGYQASRPQRRTDEDGSFRIGIAHHGRYSLRATAITRPGEMYRQAVSEVYTGPRADIELKLAAPSDPVPPVALEVVAKGSGQPVAGARAAIVWQDPRSVNLLSLTSALRTSGQVTGADGKAELPGPQGQQPPQGSLLVQAKGFAPGVVKKVEHDGEQPTRVKIELEPAAVVRGTVVDEASGKPLPGARILARPAGLDGPQYSKYGDFGPGPAVAEGITADAAGQFSVGDLGPGEYVVRAQLDGRPTSEALRVTVKAGETSNALRIVIPTGMVLSGTVFGGLGADGTRQPLRLQGDWRVGLDATSQSSAGYRSFGMFGRIGYGGENADQSSVGPVPIAADGSFRFAGLAAGRYRFQVIAPPVGLRAAAVTAIIEPLRIRHRDLVRHFDLSEDLPGIVRGRVEVTGVRFPVGRLLVMSRSLGSASRRPSRVAYNRAYFRCLVAKDGSFEFRASPGRHHVYIMDGAASTVLFHAEDPVQVAHDRVAKVSYRIPLTRVRVRLLPQDPGGGFVASQLEWLALHPGDSRDSSFGPYDTGRGWPVQGGREFLITLPPVRTLFSVRAALSNVDPNGGHYQLMLGEGEVLPVLGELKTLDIRVNPPPDVTNPAPDPVPGKARK